tara:strand:+ start:1669 stop:1947 length:279 start_codon:yes stop_codon:yes gene_type:complete
LTDDLGGNYHPPRAVQHVSNLVDTDRPHFQKTLKFIVVHETKKGFQRQPEAFQIKLKILFINSNYLSSFFYKNSITLIFAKKRPTIIDQIEN